MSDLVVDYFAGMGGWEVALAERGLRGLAVERAPHPRATLLANGVELVGDDVETVDLDALPPLAGRVGSPPCQTRSQARGTTDLVDDARHGLLFTFGAHALADLPPFVAAEITPRGRLDFALVADDLRAAGYAADVRVVNAADYGLPQARKRAVLAARRDGRPVAWPEPTHADPTTPAGRQAIDAGLRLPWVTLAQALPHRDDLPAWAHVRPAVTVVGSFRPEVLAAPGWRKPGDRPRQHTPDSVVTTLDERRLLQGFPASWQIVGPQTAASLMLGNAIPPALARVALTAALDDAVAPVLP